MTKAPELKPCPFCGKALINHYLHYPEVFKHPEGTTCFAGKAIIHPENYEAWNRRILINLAPATPAQAVDVLLPLVTDEVADELRAIAEGVSHE